MTSIYASITTTTSIATTTITTTSITTTTIITSTFVLLLLPAVIIPSPYNLPMMGRQHSSKTIFTGPLQTLTTPIIQFCFKKFGDWCDIICCYDNYQHLLEKVCQQCNTPADRKACHCLQQSINFICQSNTVVKLWGKLELYQLQPVSLLVDTNSGGYNGGGGYGGGGYGSGGYGGGGGYGGVNTGHGYDSKKRDLLQLNPFKGYSNGSKIITPTITAKKRALEEYSMIEHIVPTNLPNYVIYLKEILYNGYGYVKEDINWNSNLGVCLPRRY
eukprot:TRINITY_DN2757_c0_g1_i2.p1 TRINITY_DN2757_c0_g1~~TRINITY_DN2757_c0_g1_i2.p1  ORF type:complete len:273 (-),score=45.68 TRINITY_DN2757_c0_g1_i2:85-903(-)